MNFKALSATVLISLSSITAFSQCQIDIVASDTTVPCGGGVVTLTASGTMSTNPIDNDFDLGFAGPGWSVSPAGQFNNPCDPSFDGGTYMWMGNTTAAPRTLETAPLDLTCGGQVCFYLDFATQGGTGSCEGPDLPNEGVFFEYSIDGGLTWVTINYFQPNAGGVAGTITTWNQYCYPIPAAAQTATTILHWYQDGSSGPCCDHWGIDNVVVTATGCNVSWLDWQHIPGTVGPTGDPATQVVNVTSDTTFVCCLTDGLGITCCDTVTITLLLDTPTVAITNPVCSLSCDGEILVTPINGLAPYTYTWSNGAGNTNNATALCEGAYTATVEDAAGCSIELDNLMVTDPPAMTIQNISTTSESCLNHCDGGITITEPTAVLFTIDDGVNSTTQATGVFTGLCAGNYTITVEDANGCQATSAATVGTLPPLILIVNLDTTICENGTAVLSASAMGSTGNYTFIWDQGLPNGSSQTVNPTDTTTYEVFVQDASGCTSTPLGITVSVRPPLSVTASGLPLQICPGQETSNISAFATGGDGNYSFSWTDGPNNWIGENQTVGPINATTYTVTVQDGCESTPASDQILIDVFELPDVQFSANNLEDCKPLVTQFTNNTDPAMTMSCAWSFGDFTNANDCNPPHTYPDPGCYDVSLTVTSPDGCVASALKADYICVSDIPIARFSFRPNPASVVNSKVIFNNLSTGATNYVWNIGHNGYVTTEVSPIYEYPLDSAGQYEVCLEAYNDVGCADTTCQTVIVEPEFLMYVPNSFTPNGDGVNDVFRPVFTYVDPEEYQLMIFDRWGEMIFKTTSYSNGWDGTTSFSTGIAPTGVYVWKIIAKSKMTPEVKDYYGHVNLLR